MDDEQQHQQQQGIHQEDQDDQQREQAASKRKRLITLLLISSAVISYLLLFITFQIFIAIKLDSSVTSWSWAVVFIPWWILESAHLAISLKSFVFEIISGKMTVNTVYPNDNEDGDDENRESTVNYQDLSNAR